MQVKNTQPNVRRIANLQGLGYLTLTTTVEQTFSPDREYWITELHFFNTSSLALTDTVKMYLGGQQLFGGAGIELGLLQDRVAANAQASGGTGTVVFKLPDPVPVSRSMPLKITATVATGTLKCLVWGVDPDPTTV